MIEHPLRKVSNFWLQNVHPKLASLNATIGSVGLVLCLLNIFLLAKLSGEVWEREVFTFDQSLLLWIHQFANPILDDLMLMITKLNNPEVTVTVSGISLAILWWQGFRREAKIFAVNAFGGVVLSYGLKLAFNKARPQLWEQLISETSFSYPSGHALGSIVLYGFLAYLFATNYQKFAKVIYSFAALMITAIGFSRLYLGVHWPTDIIAGYSIGFLWLMLGITMLKLQKTSALSH